METTALRECEDQDDSESQVLESRQPVRQQSKSVWLYALASLVAVAGLGAVGWTSKQTAQLGDVDSLVSLSGSWDSYIDFVTGHSEGNCDRAAIIGTNGHKWTTDGHAAALKITLPEADFLAKAIKSGADASSFQELTVEGINYVFLRSIQDDMWVATKKDNGGITLRKTGSTIVIAHTVVEGSQGKTNLAVEYMGDYLSSNGMRRRLAGDEFEEPLVLELATEMNAGPAGEDEPQFGQPSVVGKLQKDVYFGKDALTKVEQSELIYPIKHGVVHDWAAEEGLIRFAFSTLGSDPSQKAVLLSETTLNPVHNRENMTKMMFETFKSPAMYLANNAVLAAYATGRTTAIVLYVDEDFTQAVPIYEGHALVYATLDSQVGSLPLTQCMAKSLVEKGNSFKSNNVRDEVAQDIIKTLAYVSLDPEAEAQPVKSYKTSDGQDIDLDEKLFKCPEALFDPSLISLETEVGVPEMIYNAIMKTTVNIRKDLYANIILAGPGATFPGIADRIKKEVAALAPPTMRIKVIASLDGAHQTWIGGSIFGSLSTFNKFVVSKAEYEQHGPKVVHYKCF